MSNEVKHGLPMLPMSKYVNGPAKDKEKRLRDSVELPAIWQQLSAGNMQAESTTNAADQHLAMLIFERF
jgi:hypothetical protein